MVPPYLSVVIPVFNEERNLAALVARLLPVLDGMDVAYEVIFVDDGSRDATLERLFEVRRDDPNIVVLSFARNFGQHAAITAGFEASAGQFVVTMDADLQNPPEEIPRLVDQFRLGHDLVGTIRMNRRDSAFRLSVSALANGMTRRISGIQIRDFGCMLRGYSRRIAKDIAGLGETRTFIPALGYLFAGNPTEIEVGHAAREVGKSNYSLLSLLRLHLDLMTGFSLSPLRILISTGTVIGALGALFGVWLLVMRLTYGAQWAADGVFTLFAILFCFIGAQFVAFGLLGEYVGRIFETVRKRPPYVLRDVPDDGRTAADPVAERSAAVRP